MSGERGKRSRTRMRRERKERMGRVGVGEGRADQEDWKEEEE